MRAPVECDVELKAAQTRFEKDDPMYRVLVMNDEAGGERKTD
jgi:hypothetical protein